jgi:hypothetical protein
MNKQTDTKDPKVAWVDKLPYCDLHKANGLFEVALYDARTTPESPGKGSWGYLCEDHFQRFTRRTLGVGLGQELKVRTRLG